MSEYSQFGKLTPKGEQIISYMEAQKDALSDPARFAQLSGMVKHYLINVTSMGVIRPAQWLEDYPSSAAAVWTLVEANEQRVAEAQKVEETGDKVSALTESLEALKQELAQATARIAELEGKKPGRKAKAVKEDEEVKPADPEEAEEDKKDEEEAKAEEPAKTEE